MAWSWSHSEEAYRNAEANLRDLQLSTLVEILAEWHATSIDGGIDLSRFNLVKADISGSMSHAEICDEIFDRAKDQATCDNGGFNAWMCPHGCGAHTVSFDREGETDGD